MKGTQAPGNPMDMVNQIMKSQGMDMGNIANQAKDSQNKIAECLDLTRLNSDEIQSIKATQCEILKTLGRIDAQIMILSQGLGELLADKTDTQNTPPVPVIKPENPIMPHEGG